jgi:hypothetical protein
MYSEEERIPLGTAGLTLILTTSPERKPNYEGRVIVRHNTRDAMKRIKKMLEE